MLVAIVKEARGDETRVALEQDYQAVGAGISTDRAGLLGSADVLPVVNIPPPEDQQKLKSGAVVIGFLRPLDDPSALDAAVGRGATLFSMELVPRITRAQSMDALSSMATVAGYKAVIMAADHLPKLFPLLMTAAGTIPPARVLVLSVSTA